MDPTKFPVDSLIKRLQLLVSRSLEHSIEALRSGSPRVLNEIRRIQEEVDELYWLIVRQLLVALSDREISSKIGLESPLHTSGDRVSAKTIEEIGRIILELTEETVNSKETGIKIEETVMDRIEGLAREGPGLLRSDHREPADSGHTHDREGAAEDRGHPAAREGDDAGAPGGRSSPT